MSFAAFALALALNQAPGVLVRCTDPCAVKLDGKAGRKVDEKTWEVTGISPGSLKLEVSGRAGAIYVGPVNVAALGSAVDVDASGHVSVTPPASYAPPPPPPPPAPQAPVPAAPAPSGGVLPPSTWPSTVHVRCAQECTATVDGLGGRRLSSQDWEIANVQPGQRRVEATTTFGIKLATGFVDVPGGSNAEIVVTHNRVALGTVTPMAAPAASSPALSGPSTLHVVCPKACVVYIDNQKRSGENATATIPYIEPGRHGIEARYFGGASRGSIEVPAGSDVYVVASESGTLNITNSKPLQK